MAVIRTASRLESRWLEGFRCRKDMRLMVCKCCERESVNAVSAFVEGRINRICNRKNFIELHLEISRKLYRGLK